MATTPDASESAPIVTLELQDQFDKALSDLTDAIHAAKAMSHVVGLKDDMVRNDAMSVVVLALEKAFCAIDDVWPRIPYEGPAKDAARRLAERTREGSDGSENQP